MLDTVDKSHSFLEWQIPEEQYPAHTTRLLLSETQMYPGRAKTVSGDELGKSVKIIHHFLE